MNIGMFLDVDRTLTAGPIQNTVARHLEVEAEYQQIEQQFEGGKITSSTFGQRIIALFNRAGFTRRLGDELYQTVQRTEWCEDLLTLPVERYLVSAGPSYYVRKLGEEFGIAKENVLCSEYLFAEDGTLSSCKPISPVRKKNFVIQRRSNHSLTIGLGDSQLLDGPFVSECHIPILTESALGFLATEGLDAVQTMVSRLAEQYPSEVRTQPTVFIGSSTENLNLANAMYEHLAKPGFRPRTWEDGVFQPGKVNIEALEGSLSEFDFAVFVMAGDDVRITRGVEEPAVRDNIIFELGLFMGRLGRQRCFLLYPRENEPRLPSDIDGVIRLAYEATEEPTHALKASALKMLRIVKQLGCRDLRV